jgi:hypothetical protein
LTRGLKVALIRPEFGATEQDLLTGKAPLPKVGVSGTFLFANKGIKSEI